MQCSTIGIYGNVANPPANEDAPIKPDDYYQESKFAGERIALEVGAELGLPVVVIRPAAIYGPLEPRFIKLARLIAKRRFVMFGDGRAYYHFIHVDDLSAAFVLAAECEGIEGEAFIIADEHPLTVQEVVHLFADSLGVPHPRLRLPLGLLTASAAICETLCRPFGISPPIHSRRAAWFSSNRAFDIGKARARLGFAPRVAPEDGLREMIASYVEAGWIDGGSAREAAQ